MVSALASLPTKAACGLFSFPDLESPNMELSMQPVAYQLILKLGHVEGGISQIDRVPAPGCSQPGQKQGQVNSTLSNT